MRSRTVQSNRRLFRGVLLLALAGPLLLGTGCQHNRSFFQMDSNSRVPFFGMDFTPQWPKRSSRSSTGVSRLQSDPPSPAAEPDDPDAHAPEQSIATSVSLALPAADLPAVRRTSDSGPVEAFR